VSHEFLSTDWFDAVTALATEAPEPPAAIADLKVNLTIPGHAEAHMAGGAFGMGHIDGAAATVSMPHEVAKAMLIDGNPQAAMQAFMSGQIQVQGDITKLMALQTVQPSPEQLAFAAKLRDLTA